MKRFLSVRNFTAVYLVVSVITFILNANAADTVGTSTYGESQATGNARLCFTLSGLDYDKKDKPTADQLKAIQKCLNDQKGTNDTCSTAIENYNTAAKDAKDACANAGVTDCTLKSFDACSDQIDDVGADTSLQDIITSALSGTVPNSAKSKYTPDCPSISQEAWKKQSDDAFNDQSTAQKSIADIQKRQADDASKLQEGQLSTKETQNSVLQSAADLKNDLAQTNLNLSQSMKDNIRKMMNDMYQRNADLANARTKLTQLQSAKTEALREITRKCDNELYQNMITYTNKGGTNGVNAITGSAKTKAALLNKLNQRCLASQVTTKQNYDAQISEAETAIQNAESAVEQTQQAIADARVAAQQQDAINMSKAQTKQAALQAQYSESIDKLNSIQQSINNMQSSYQTEMQAAQSQLNRANGQIKMLQAFGDSGPAGTSGNYLQAMGAVKDRNRLYPSIANCQGRPLNPDENDPNTTKDIGPAAK